MSNIDLECPDLYVGKEIGEKYLKGKIVSIDNNKMMMEIIHVNDKYFERYLDAENCPFA